ncbi:hypothetical protein [Homoserinimonas hongtaonis]|nr:hypothetical protein [Salinibacterium hongtaonis]
MAPLVETNRIRGTRAAEADSPRHAAAPSELLWTEMGAGVWVAKRQSDFAGLIEKLWGAGYRVTDHNGRIVGEFSSLASARDQLL